MNDEALVTVAEFYHPGGVVQADVARARLEQEGIGAWLAEESLSGLFPHLAAAGGGIKVLVRKADATHARAILMQARVLVEESDVEGERFELAAEDEEDEDSEATDEGPHSSEEEVVCPECGSADVVRKSFARTATGIITITIVVFLVVAVVIGALRPVLLVIPAVLIPSVVRAAGRRYECWRCRHRWEEKDSR